MASTIDPYYEWLGIPPKDQPPNLYRLLGLELFEENRNVIDTAANRQMSFIKTYQTGPPETEELSQQILNELAAARLCLLNPEKKKAYDEQLRAALAKPPAETAPVPAERWRTEDPPKTATVIPKHVERDAPRRVPMASPVAEAPVLPPAAATQPRLPEPHTSPAAYPAAAITSPGMADPRGMDRAGAAHSLRVQDHVSEGKLIAVAVAAGLGCLLLAVVLIAWFTARLKPEVAAEREAQSLAGSSALPGESPNLAASGKEFPASAREMEQPEPAEPELDASSEEDGVVAANEPSGEPPPSSPFGTVGEMISAANDSGDSGSSLSSPITSPSTESASAQELSLNPTATPVNPIVPVPVNEAVPVIKPSIEPSVPEVIAPASAEVGLPDEPPGQIVLLITEAQQLVDRRDYEDAKKRLLQVNLVERDHRQMCFYLGLLAGLVEHDIGDARKYFVRARGSGAQDVPCLNNLGIVAVRARDTSQAIRYWKEALDIEPAAEVCHNVRLMLSLADRNRVDVASGARESIEEVLQALSLSGELKEADPAGRRPRSIPRATSFSRGWRYMDYAGESLGSSGWEWPDLSDRSCLQCNGAQTTDCPARGCSRGRVRVSTYDTIPAGGGTIIKKQRIVAVPCKTCNSTGRVSCPFCSGGIDRDL